MGAINNAFNQAAGTVAGAALIIQHAKETDESKVNSAENSALAARNEARAAETEARAANDEYAKEGGLADQIATARRNKAKAEKAYDKAKNRKNGALKTILSKRNDLMAAQEAVHQLNDKYKAIQNIRDRATEQIVHAAKATKLAQEAQEKFKKRWGGK